MAKLPNQVTSKDSQVSN